VARLEKGENTVRFCGTEGGATATEQEIMISAGNGWRVSSAESSVFGPLPKHRPKIQKYVLRTRAKNSDLLSVFANGPALRPLRFACATTVRCCLAGKLVAIELGAGNIVPREMITTPVTQNGTMSGTAIIAAQVK